MMVDNNQNLYRNWDQSEQNGRFDHRHHHDHGEQKLVQHHKPLAVSASAALDGSSSNNGGIVCSFDQTSNHQTASKILNLHPQGGSPIGLTLRKSTSLINLVEMTLSQERQQKQPIPEKLKASNFPAALLQIGSWKRISRNEGDLVAKLYYAKKKLVWEFLEGPLKSKIEVKWSDISAIRAFTYDGETGCLDIELNQPPQFGRELNPQPRKHTQWKQTTDFTDGQATIYRRHSVIFPPGVLDKQYEKLLQSDDRLFNLSQQPFPVNNNPFFFHDSNLYSYMDVHHGIPSHFLGDLDSNSPMSVTRDEGARRHTNENPERGMSHFEGVPTIPIGVQSYGQEPWIPIQQSDAKMLVNSMGYVNDGTWGIGVQEPNSWVGVPDPYGLPWEPGMEVLEGHQHHNTNWT